MIDLQSHSTYSDGELPPAEVIAAAAEAGVTTVALFMMHGAIYAVMKTEGTLQDKLRGWVNNCIILFIICYAITTMATLLYLPHMAARLRAQPILFSVAILNMLAIANIPFLFSRAASRSCTGSPTLSLTASSIDSRGHGGVKSSVAPWYVRRVVPQVRSIAVATSRSVNSSMTPRSANAR